MSILQYYKPKSKVVCSFGKTAKLASQSKQTLIESITANNTGIVEDAYKKYTVDRDRTLLMVRDETLPQSEYKGDPIYANVTKYKEVVYR